MSTTTLLRTDTLPRVNLLPPEIAEAARFRNVQLALGLAVGAAVVVVGGLTYLAMGEVDSAQTEVDTAQAQTVTLQADVAKYAEVPAVYASLDALKAQRAQAMSQEIRYSFVLKDLSLSMPSGVWLTNVTVTQQVDPTTVVKGAWGTPALGTVVLSGETGTLPQVAAWLEALGRQKAYTDPYLTTATQTTGNLPPGYTFTSSVALTSKALTNRYANKAGS